MTIITLTVLPATNPIKNTVSLPIDYSCYCTFFETLLPSKSLRSCIRLRFSFIFFSETLLITSINATSYVSELRICISLNTFYISSHVLLYCLPSISSITYVSLVTKLMLSPTFSTIHNFMFSYVLLGCLNIDFYSPFPPGPTIINAG